MSIEARVPPEDTVYVEGEHFNFDSMIITATYSDGTTENVWFDSLGPGQMSLDVTEVTVTYQDKSSTIPVTVSPRIPQVLNIFGNPAKTNYRIGEEFDPLGITVFVEYNGEQHRSEQLLNYNWTPERFEQPGEQYVTIYYTENGATVTAQILVNVSSN